MIGVFIAIVLAVSPEMAPLFRQARLAEQHREFAEAVRLYDRILSIDPRVAEVWTNKGLVLYELNRHREALAAFAQAAALKPELLTPHLFLGIEYARLGEPQKALAPLRKALAIEPDHPQASYELARVHGQLEQFEEAVGLYRRILRRDPKLEQARYGLGIAYLNWSKSAARRLLDRPAPSPYGKILLGEMEAIRGIVADAEANLQSAVRELPESPEAHAALGRYYQDHGQTDKAREHLAFADKLRPPGRPTAADDRGLYWLALSCRTLAREAFWEAVSQNPVSYRAHLLLADLARDSGDAAQAAAEYKKAVALGSSDPEAHLTYIQFLTSQGQDALAWQRAQAAVEQFPGHARLNCEAGRLLLTMHSGQDAAPYFRRALEAEPTLVAARAGLADSLAAAGRISEAVREMEQALAGDVDGSLHYRLGRWRQASGAAEKARQAFETSTRLKERNRQEEIKKLFVAAQ